MPTRFALGEFPPVLRLAEVAQVKTHASYAAAKAGDVQAARQLVQGLVLPELARRTWPGPWVSDVVLCSAHAYEEAGINAIPHALACHLAQCLNLAVEAGIVQANAVRHTGASGVARLARQAQFSGQVSRGARYVLIDDFVGMGGTLANLCGHITSAGGVVVGACVLTCQPRSTTLALSPVTLATLRRAHGSEFESWWRHRYGHGFDCLTESEARYLARVEDAVALRDRIAAAEQG